MSDVWVPAAYLPGYTDYCPISPRWSTASEDDGLVMVDYNDGDQIAVPAERVIHDPGFLVLEIAPIDSDHTVTVAAVATFKSLESLFAACSPNVQHIQVASAVELEEVMRRLGRLWSHIVIIAHGDESGGVQLLDRPDPVGGAELANLLGCHDEVSRDCQIISLCCNSGCEEFAQVLSKAAHVTEVIAPHGEFDLRWAVVFVTGYFLEFFTRQDSVESAAMTASEFGKCDMRIWQGGTMLTSSSTILSLSPKDINKPFPSNGK